MKANDEQPESKQSKRDPFCWIEKQKLRMIGDVFTENTGLASIESARSTYLALAEIASDNERDDNLDVSQHAIARRAGLSVSTVKRILPVFKRLGLIKIKPNSINGLQTRSTYTLIRGALAHCAPTLAQDAKTKRATSEESLEESFEGKEAARKKKEGEACGRSLAADQRDLTARSKPSPNGEGFNPKSGEYEW
jgi:DNA-binding MarR family transcriptional regulator